MKKILLAMFLFSMSLSVNALGLNTGKDVLEACQITKDFLDGQSTESSDAEACVHFLMGFDSGQAISSIAFEQPNIYCQPAGTNIGNMVSIVTEALADDATYHEAPAGIAVWQVLSTSWPCG